MSISFRELFHTFGRIGLLSFGGPAGQIALMHRILVDEKQWLDEKRFLHALNFCMLLPGPEAMQLATYAGWLLRGVWGGLLAGLLFVIPGSLVLLGLSVLYVKLGDVPIVEGLLFGLKAAVLAIVVQALIKVSKRALKGWQSYLVAALALVMLAVFHMPFPLVILLAGLVGLALPEVFGDTRHVPVQAPVVRPYAHVAKVLVGAGIFWLLPVAVLYYTLGRGNVFVDEALFFSKAAVVTFGGAYAVLAYVGQQAVEIFGWLKPDEMLTGLGLAETTPGPLILVLVFVGFVGAFRDSGVLDPLLAGALGALVTLWVTFVPCFIWIFLGAPFVEVLRGDRYLAGALAAITAAVVGVIANLSLWFAVHVLFGEVARVDLFGGGMDMPVLASFDIRAVLIAAGSAFYLLRGGGLLTLLVASTLAGAGLAYFG
jgi:chromate transporter